MRDDLTTAAAAGDEATRKTAALLAAALEPAARLTIMNALADLAAEVTAAQDDHIVDVRLAGRDAQVQVTPTGSVVGGGHTADKDNDRRSEQHGGDVSRMTLRLFEQLKNKAEEAAAAQGVSLNNFVQQAVQGALSGRHGKRWSKWDDWTPGTSDTGGSRVRGWYEG